MDNNQQSKEGGTEQPSVATPVVEQAGPSSPLANAPKTDLGVNNPSSIPVGSAFTGRDVSMTTPQVAGGTIRTTEVGSK
jgi:hypothetical protein